MNKIQIRFDGPPGPEAGRFVEVEDASGKSIRIGDWKQDGDYWLLVMDDPRQARNQGIEEAARLHEQIDPSCDHERQNGDPGAGAMGAVIEYRDAIRNLKTEQE